MSQQLNISYEIIILQKITDMIKNDNILSIVDTENTIMAIKQLFTSVVFLEKIQNDVSIIVTNGVNIINDIPAIVHLIIDSKNFIHEIIGQHIVISSNMMKYIVFGILYHIILSNGVVTENENIILNNYESIWKLLSYDPVQLITKENILKTYQNLLKTFIVQLLTCRKE